MCGYQCNQDHWSKPYHTLPGLRTVHAVQNIMEPIEPVTAAADSVIQCIAKSVMAAVNSYWDATVPVGTFSIIIGGIRNSHSSNC